MASLMSQKSKPGKKARAARVLKAAAAADAGHQATPFKAVTKTTDSKGRLVLGGKYANRAVIVEQLSETEMVIKLARVIPEREAWLYENAEALAAVRNGLAQARAGKVSGGPNVDADADLAARLED
jgi:hypothetical protein